MNITFGWVALTFFVVGVFALLDAITGKTTPLDFYQTGFIAFALLVLDRLHEQKKFEKWVKEKMREEAK